MLSLSAGARFTNFKAILMQVIVGSVITLINCEVISVKIPKSILNICAKGGRFNNSKAELMEIISEKIQKRYIKW